MVRSECDWLVVIINKRKERKKIIMFKVFIEKSSAFLKKKVVYW